MTCLRRLDVIGLPVIHRQFGKPIGRVEELLFNKPGGRLIGFTLMGGTWWHGVPVYPFEEVAVIGVSAILVRDAEAVLTAKHQEKLDELKANSVRLVGKRIIDDSGNDLGYIDDVFFETSRGMIVGYQISRGIIQDLLFCKTFISADSDLAWGKEVAILRRAEILGHTDRPGGSICDAQTAEEEARER